MANCPVAMQESRHTSVGSGTERPLTNRGPSIRSEEGVWVKEGRGNGAKGLTLDDDAAKALVRQGQEAGFLTQEEVALALDELDLDTTQIDEFYQQLDELHIEVVESEPEEEEEEATTAQPDAAEVSTDSLQLFLKDIGKVPLLTAAQEVELSKRIERGDHRAKQQGGE